MVVDPPGFRNRTGRLSRRSTRCAGFTHSLLDGADHPRQLCSGPPLAHDAVHYGLRRGVKERVDGWHGGDW
ncbi:MAG: hypothetical protein QOH21_807 [Acidobacteriota bacterium]|jgi:hypothetical protein|nr:hypothetical protein [Acidobacteriota bacterium]